MVARGSRGRRRLCGVVWVVGEERGEWSGEARVWSRDLPTDGEMIGREGSLDGVGRLRWR